MHNVMFPSRVAKSTQKYGIIPLESMNINNVCDTCTVALQL